MGASPGATHRNVLAAPILYRLCGGPDHSALVVAMPRARSEATVQLVRDELERAHSGLDCFGSDLQRGEDPPGGAQGDELHARDAVAALDILGATEAIQLLFTDIVLLGGANGTQLAQQAVTIFPRLKVLFASGYSEEAVWRDSATPVNAELLRKP